MIEEIIHRLKVGYIRLKIALWWKYAIEENEFSRKLDIYYLTSALGYTVKDGAWVLIARRELAHRLDLGDEVSDIPIVYLVKAKIELKELFWTK